MCVPLLLEHLHQAASDCCSNLSSLGALDPQGQYDWNVNEGDTNYADLRLLRLAKTLRSVWATPPAAVSKEQAASDKNEHGGAGEHEVALVGGSAAGSSAAGSCSTEIAMDACLSGVVGEDSLWSLLGSCLAAIESQQAGTTKGASGVSSISPALSRLQPLVEAYFVIHAPMAPPAVPGAAAISPQGGPEPLPAPLTSRSRSGGLGDATPGAVEGWIDFAERHRNALNAYLRQVLEPSPSFSPSPQPLVPFPSLFSPSLFHPWILRLARAQCMCHAPGKAFVFAVYLFEHTGLSWCWVNSWEAR